MSRPRFRTLLWLAPVVLVAALAATHVLWLRALGYALVESEQPFSADMIVVLAGDDSGNRVLKAAELVRQGYAPRILVSGTECCYGNEESELAVAFAVKRGYPREWFIPFPVRGDSTVEEAPALLAEMRRRNARRFLVVTSNYHTRRSRRVWAALAPPESFRVIAAPDRYFRPEDWWLRRQARKILYFEWSKTMAHWLGL